MSNVSRETSEGNGGSEGWEALGGYERVNPPPQKQTDVRKVKIERLFDLHNMEKLYPHMLIKLWIKWMPLIRANLRFNGFCLLVSILISG